MTRDASRAFTVVPAFFEALPNFPWVQRLRLVFPIQAVSLSWHSALCLASHHSLTPGLDVMPRGLCGLWRRGTVTPG